MDLYSSSTNSRFRTRSQLKHLCSGLFVLSIFRAPDAAPADNVKTCLLITNLKPSEGIEVFCHKLDGRIDSVTSRRRDRTLFGSASCRIPFEACEDILASPCCLVEAFGCPFVPSLGLSVSNLVDRPSLFDSLVSSSDLLQFSLVVLASRELRAVR